MSNPTTSSLLDRDLSLSVSESDISHDSSSPPATIPIHLSAGSDSINNDTNAHNTSVADLLSLSTNEDEEGEGDDFLANELTALDALEMGSLNDDDVIGGDYYGEHDYGEHDEGGQGGYEVGDSVRGGVVGDIVNDIVDGVGGEVKAAEQKVEFKVEEVKPERSPQVTTPEPPNYKFMYTYKYGGSQHESDRKERLGREQLKLRDLRKGEGLVRSEPYVIGKEVLGIFYEEDGEVGKQEFKRGESLGEDIIKSEEFKQPLGKYKAILRAWRQKSVMRAFLKWVKFGYMVSAERERAAKLATDDVKVSEILKQASQSEAQRDLEIAMDVIVMLQQENHVLSSQVKGLLLQTQGIKTAAMRVINGQQQANANANMKENKMKQSGMGGGRKTLVERNSSGAKGRKGKAF